MRGGTLVVLAVLLLASAAGCGRGPSDAGSQGAETPGASAPVTPVTDGPAPRRAITLLWPGAQAEGLIAREAEIFATRDAADQARQVVGLLLAGAPDETIVAPFPAGTRLTALFVDERGIAYVSLSREGGIL